MKVDQKRLEKGRSRRQWNLHLLVAAWVTLNSLCPWNYISLGKGTKNIPDTFQESIEASWDVNWVFLFPSQLSVWVVSWLPKPVPKGPERSRPEQGGKGQELDAKNQRKKRLLQHHQCVWADQPNQPHLQTESLLYVEDARTNKHYLQVKINKPNQAVCVHTTVSQAC